MLVSELEARTLERLGETSSAGGYYTPGQVRIALSEGQRLFAFLTLCLEATDTLPLTANTCWYAPLATLPRLIVPLRVRIAGPTGTKLEPKRLEELDALDATWQSAPGPPRRYACVGPNLLAIHPQPTARGAALTVTHARSPIPLVGSGQTPEIPEEYHPFLIRYAVPRLRTSEGAEEWRKNLPDFMEFWQAAKKLAMYVRARNQSAQYDHLPPEQQFFDTSRLAQRRTPWQTISASRPAPAAPSQPMT